MKPSQHGVPDRRWCLRLMAEMEMMEHIAAHSLRVWQVACVIAHGLAASDHPLNLQLTEAGALLHDITKTRSLTTGENHAASGQKLLMELGLEKIGPLVGQHVTLNNYPPETLDEAVIINYADKRVNHDQVVNLAQRGDYILTTYGTNSGNRRRIRQLWGHTQRIEQRIFKNLPFTPDDMVRHLDSAAFDASLQQFRHFARLDL